MVVRPRPSALAEAPHDDLRTLDGDVHVSPRHLAAATATGNPALAPLLDLGWDLEHDDLGNAYVHAPDRTVRLGYLPEGEDDGLWRINAYRDAFGPPAWGVCFNDSCPTEFVRAFTTALAEAYEQGPDACLAAPDPQSADREPFLAAAPLINRGWQLERPSGGVLAIRSPDGYAGLEFTTGPLDPQAELTSRDARWQLWAGTSIDPRLVRHRRHRHSRRPAQSRHRVRLRPGSATAVARGDLQLRPGHGPAHSRPPAVPAGADPARRSAGRLPPLCCAPGLLRAVLEHHQPPGPARPSALTARSPTVPEASVWPCTPATSSWNT